MTPKFDILIAELNFPSVPPSPPDDNEEAIAKAEAERDEMKARIDELRKRMALNYRHIVKDQFGIDLVGHMVNKDFAKNDVDSDDWIFEKGPIRVQLQFDITSKETSLNTIYATDTASGDTIVWNKVDSFNKNSSPKQIFNFIFHGQRPGESQSFAENKEPKY